jgi:GDP-D-mannose 3',5'-epimerase
MSRTLVTGAGGFIGGHLTRELLSNGHEVLAIDSKPLSEWYQLPEGCTTRTTDMSLLENCREAAGDIDVVYNLAADMGGMGFIENNRALCMLSVLINTHMLMAASEFGVGRFFYSSSACIYPVDRQENPDVVALKEQDAYPALPEDGYGWEKLFSERMCRHYLEDFGLETRVARFHNVYGPLGTYEGGREKAPAAICRKIAAAKISGSNEIEIWGDGEQTRSFMFIDDCVEGIGLITDSDYRDPVNLGSSELVTINEMVSMVEEIAGVKLQRNYDLSAPQGVRGRNSDNSLINEVLGWEPSIRLKEGLGRTFDWIYSEMTR